MQCGEREQQLGFVLIFYVGWAPPLYVFVSGWSGWNQYLWRGEDIRYQIPEGGQLCLLP